MRAPAESTSQNTGISWARPYSVKRMIFSTVRAPHEPAFTVVSLATTHTGRPSTMPVPVTTPSAGSPSAEVLASSASSRSEPSSSSNASRSRTCSLLSRASLSAPLSRLPWSARALAASASMPLGLPNGHDGDVVGHGRRGEIARRGQQRLAQHRRTRSRVATEGPGDAVLPEQLLARTRFGQAVGVEKQKVALLELHLAAPVVGVGVDREERPRGPQRADFPVVP